MAAAADADSVGGAAGTAGVDAGVVPVLALSSQRGGTSLCVILGESRFGGGGDGGGGGGGWEREREREREREKGERSRAAKETFFLRMDLIYLGYGVQE